MNRESPSVILRIGDVVGLPLTLFAFVYFAFGYYYEVNDDVLIDLALRGIGWSEPMTNLYMWHRFTGSLIALMYQAFPTIPWYGIFLIFFNVVTLINIYWILRIILGRFLSTWRIRVLFVLCFFLIFFESVLLVQYTRTAIMLPATSILLMALKLNQDFTPGKVIEYTWLFSLLIVGLCIRPEGALLGLVMLAPVLILMVINGTVPFRRMFIFFIILIASVSTFNLSMRLSRTDTQIQDEKRIPALMSWIAYIDKPPILSSSRADSLVYQSLLINLYSDRDKLTPDYLASLGKEHRALDLDNFEPVKLLNALSLYPKLFFKNHPVLALQTIGLLFAIIAGLLNNTNRMYLLFYLGFHLFIWAIILGTACAYKMPPRVLTPLFYLYLIAHWVIGCFVFRDRILTFYPRLSIVFLTLILAGSVMYGYRTAKKIDWLRQRMNNNSAFLADAISGHDKSVVVFNNSSVHLFSGLDPLKHSIIPGEKQIVMLSTWMTWYFAFNHYLKTISGSEKTVDFFRYLLDQHGRHIFVSSSKENDILEQYYLILYGLDFRFEKFRPNHTYKEPTFGTELQYYMIQYATDNHDK